MSIINLYVSQKYVDLNVISAKQALRIYLNKHKCVDLTRYVHWVIDVDSDDDDKECINKLTLGSYLLCNPNKEEVVDTLDLNNQSVVYVDVASRLSIKNNDFKLQLTRLSNLTINSIEKRIVWGCRIDCADQSLRKSYVEKDLLGIKGVSSGLLMNPIYETYSFLN